MSARRCFAFLALLACVACGELDEQPAEGNGPTVECGIGTTLVEGVCELDPDYEIDAPAVVTHLRLLHAAIETPAPHRVLHPVDLAVTLEIGGDPLTGDLLVAFVTPDGERGCLIDSLHFDHLDVVRDGEIATYTATDTHVIPEECADLMDEPELLLEVMFDPLGLVEIDGVPTGEPVLLGFDECVTCDDNDGTVVLADHDGPELIFDRFTLDTTVLRLFPRTGEERALTPAERYEAHVRMNANEAFELLGRCVESGIPASDDAVCNEFYGEGVCDPMEFGDTAAVEGCARCDGVFSDVDACYCRIMDSDGRCLCLATREADGSCAEFYINDVCGPFEDGVDCYCEVRDAEGRCQCAITNSDGSCRCPLAHRYSQTCPTMWEGATLYGTPWEPPAEAFVDSAAVDALAPATLLGFEVELRIAGVTPNSEVTPEDVVVEIAISPANAAEAQREDRVWRSAGSYTLEIATGNAPLALASMIAFDDFPELRDAMAEREWSDQPRFDIRACASYQGGPPTCRFVVATAERSLVTPEGFVGADGAHALGDSGSELLERNVRQMGRSWSDPLKSEYASLDNRLWWTLGGSRESSPTSFGQDGNQLVEEGLWFEAGAKSELTLFGGTVRLAQLSATYLDYLSESEEDDSLKLVVAIAGFDLIPSSWRDFSVTELTLRQMLDLYRPGIAVSFTKGVDLLGRSFGIGGFNVQLAVRAELSVGLDDEESALELNVRVPAGPTCADGELLSEDGQHCFVGLAVQDLVTRATAVGLCAPLGENRSGDLAAPRTPADEQAILRAVRLARDNASDRTLRDETRYISDVELSIDADSTWEREPPYTTTYLSGTIDKIKSGRDGEPAYVSGVNVGTRFTPRDGDDTWLPRYWVTHVIPQGSRTVPSNRVVGGFRDPPGVRLVACMVPATAGPTADVGLVGTVVPFVDASLTGGATAGFDIVDIGATVEVSLLNIRAPVVGRADLVLHRNGGVLVLGNEVTVRVSALQGAVKVWVTVENVITRVVSTIWSWVTQTDVDLTTYERTIIEWNGFELPALSVVPYQTDTFTF